MVYIAGMIALLFVLIIVLTYAFVGLHYAIEAQMDTSYLLVFIAVVVIDVVFMIVGGLKLINLLEKT